MKWISILKIMRSHAAIAVAPVLFAVSGVVYPNDQPMAPLDTKESLQLINQETRPGTTQSNKVSENIEGPLEFEIDPERVKRNQEVLDELYRNVYHYDSGVFNYEKKIN